MKLVLAPARLSRALLQELTALQINKIEIAIDETYRDIAETELALAVYVFTEGGRVFRFHGDAVRAIQGRDYASVVVDEVLSTRMLDEAPYRTRIRHAEKFAATRLSAAEIWRKVESTEVQPITRQRSSVHFVAGYVLFTPESAILIEAAEFEPSLSIVEEPETVQQLIEGAERLVLIQ
jgi:hypothetical protein